MPDLGESVSQISDLQFVRDKVKAGDWWEVTGDIDAVGNNITFVPANGKTAYLHSAKIVITAHVDPALATGGSNTTQNARNMVEADLKVDGVVKDTTNVGFNSASRVRDNVRELMGNAYGNIGDGKFNALGKSLVGDGAKEIAIENIVDNGTANATMSGWIEDT